MRFLVALSFTLASAVAYGGCSQVLGIADYHVGSPDAGGVEKLVARGSPACGQCAARSCKKEWDACERDPACVALSSCMWGCVPGDGACEGRCVDQHPVKPTAWGALFACASLECSACNDCTTFFSTLGGERCGACVGKDTGPGGVCDLMAQCTADAECLAYGACLYSDCEAFETDPECRLTCGGRYPDGARTGYIGVGTRYFTACTADCGGGQQWGCPQPAVWPGLVPGTAKVTLHLSNLSPGTTARACGNGDVSCASPIATTAGDAGSAAVFELATGSTADSGYYFELTPPAAQGAELYVPWQPIVGDLALWPPGILNASSGLDAALASRGDHADLENAGLVIAYVVDCVGGLADFGSLAPSITVAATPGEPAYYGVTGTLDAALTGGGIAVFVNLSPPSTSLKVFRNGTPIARAIVPVRSGATTVVTFNYPQFF